MAAQKGSEILIKLGDGATPDVFTTVAGLRTKNITLNTETVDVTNSDSTNKWRELLEGAGIRSASMSGGGVFKDSVSEASLLAVKLAGTIRNYQVVIPGLGTFEGAFQISQLQYAGEHNAEATYEMSLESAGELEFAA